MASLVLYITKTINEKEFYSKIDKYKSNKTDIISLSPYSNYLLEQKGIDFKTLDDFIDKVYLRDKSLELLNLLETNYKKIADNNLFFKFIYKNYLLLFFIFRSNLLANKLNKAYNEVILFSNLPLKKEIKYDEEINNSFVYLDSLKIKEFIFLETKPNKIKKIRKKIRINKEIIYKTLNKLFKNNLNYDWIYFPSINSRKKKFELGKNMKDISYFKLPDEFYIDEKKLNSLIRKQFLELTGIYEFKLNKNFIFSTMHMGNEYEKDYYAYINNIKHFNWQHGNYFYKGLFLKYYETNYNKINFVFNKYTKKIYEDLGVKEVYNVGSIIFNKPIKEKKSEYDFLYITQGHDYLGNLQYVDFPNSSHSFDGYQLYQKHKSVIELFGKKFKNQKIIIKVHPCVVGSGIYVPFWELSESYKNVIIDISTPMHTVIEKSKYIISDYFTTEFINREIHYKKDILLFNDAPTPLPSETIEDMKKMFILVESVDNLYEKVNNIENISKNRKRYDDVIEYYSSTNCDTKEVVKEVLSKNCNERR